MPNKKLSSGQQLAFFAALTLILCFLTLFYLFIAATGILPTPDQNPSLVNEADISHTNISVNNSVFNTSDDFWIGELLKPRKGGNLLRLENFGDDENGTEYYFYITLDLDSIKNEGSYDASIIDDVGFGLAHNELFYGGRWGEEGASIACQDKDGSKFYIPYSGNFSDINSMIDIRHIRKLTKKIEIEGTITISPSRLPPFQIEPDCEDRNAIPSTQDYITLSVDEIEFKIDSPIIFEWHNKGGKVEMWQFSEMFPSLKFLKILPRLLLNAI